MGTRRSSHDANRSAISCGWNATRRCDLAATIPCGTRCRSARERPGVEGTMTMYLIRHGLAAAGAEDLDPGLAEIGRQQAAISAKVFAGLNVARLLVSP